jgi:signal transduction histidine kinase
MRMTQAELMVHPAWRGFGQYAATHPPMRGWLAVPLIRRDGKNLGIVQLSDKYDDQEFTAEEETILIQLAQQASVAIENAQLLERTEQAVHARDELLASVSHDLKNPLAGIKARAQLLRRRIAPLPEQTKQALDGGLQDIDEASDRMTAIIDELIDAARPQIDHQMTLELQSINLVDLVRDEVEYAQKSTGTHHIRLITEQRRVTGRWDSTRLSRVIANLLSNAIKYSPEGGEITVTVAIPRDGPAPGNWATIAVADHGVGIPADDLPHIFERFHRAANTTGHFPGTGIGLAGARSAIAEHGGRLTVESVEGEGSIFTAWLPLDEGEAIDSAHEGA